MTKQLWWLAPLTAFWLVGMWMIGLYLRTDAPVWAVIVLLVGNVLTFAVSAFIGVKRPDVRVGQLLTLATAGFALGPFLLPEVLVFVPHWVVRVLAVLGSVMSVAALASVCWVVALFPNGRHASPRWRWISWYLGAFCVIAGTSGAIGFARADLSELDPFSDILSDGMFVTVMIALVASLASLGSRFRSGDRETRIQIGWLFYAVCLYVAFLLAFNRGLTEGVVAAALDQIVYVLIPIAIAIAVFRYRLYEIDRVVSRTVSYAIVVAVMVGVYLIVVLVLGSLLPLDGDLPVAVATLAAVGVSVPLLRRVRQFVDRRFFRFRYDSAAVVARVADDLRTTVDLSEVEARTIAVVDEVFAPESVEVWLADGPR